MSFLKFNLVTAIPSGIKILYVTRLWHESIFGCTFKINTPPPLQGAVHPWKPPAAAAVQPCPMWTDRCTNCSRTHTRVQMPVLSHWGTPRQSQTSYIPWPSMRCISLCSWDPRAAGILQRELSRMGCSTIAATAFIYRKYVEQTIFPHKSHKNDYNIISPKIGLFHQE
jgi:hypothetical protein